MVMENGLSPIREISQEEETAASLADVYDQLGTINNKFRKLEEGKRDSDNKIENLSLKFFTQDQKLDTIGKQLELVLQSLPRNATVREIGGSSHDTSSRSQDSRNQVHVSNLKPGRRIVRAGIRENLLKNVEIPVFEGSNIYSWIARVERFFRINDYNDAEKLELVSVSLDGETLSWYNWKINRRQFTSWIQFKSGLMLRFGNLKIRGPSQSLFCIKQTGTIAEYVHKFEDLSSHVTGLDDQKLEGIFLNSLTPEMQELVHMHKPKDLPEMVAIARSMESSIMRRVVKKELQLSKSDNKENMTTDYRGTGDFNSNVWKMKSIFTDSSNTGAKTGAKSDQRPRRYNTSAELDEKRRKGICFRCNGQWSREHKCPNKELRVLTVINGFEVEVLESNVEDEIEEPVGQLMELSFSSFMGILSPTTTKMRGKIGRKEITIMLDSGATHNFISPEAVKKLRLTSKEDSNLNVRLGTGITVKGMGVCNNVSFSVQELSWSTDFITLGLGQVDIILGMVVYSNDMK